MIIVRQDEPGLITIDFSNDKAFDVYTDGIEIVSGLFLREIQPQSIIAEDAGQPGVILSYIWQLLTTKGYEVTLDAASTRLLELFHTEQELVKAIRTRKVKPVTLKAPSRVGIKRALLDHQRKAVSHALTIHNAANFSVPGSGKTAIALSVYAVLRYQNIVDGLLVIGPASSFAPWEDEFYFTLGRKPKAARLIGTKPHRNRLLSYLDNVDIILCTYQMAYRERENLSRALKRARYFLILDESHHIKNINLGPWAQTALELAPFAERRMILSGTPVPHSLQDLWSQFTFLWPSQAVLGTRSQFEQKLESSEQPRGLRQDVAPFYKRTKKSDLNLPKPEPHFTKISYEDIPQRQRLIIRLLELKTLREAKDLRLGKTDVAILRKWRRARAIRLLQAASNPALLSTALSDFGEMGEPLDKEPALAAFLKDYLRHETPAKIAFVENKVRQLVSQGKKVVVWVTFVGNLELLAQNLSDLNPLKIYGDVPAYDEDSIYESRESQIRQFNDKHSGRNVLLANPAACSESVSLHKVCNNAVYLERTFNAGQFLQSMDRIHRVGMPRNTRPRYYIPLLECAIEEVVDRRLIARQRQLYELLEDDMRVLGYDEDTDSFLTEHDEDLDSLFQEIIDEISFRIDERTDGANSKGRSHR